MSAVPLPRQIELLQQLLAHDVWNEFLLPEYKQAQEILSIQLKSTKDPHEAFKLIGQQIGIDAITNLPGLLEVLIKQQEIAASQPPEPPSVASV